MKNQALLTLLLINLLPGVANNAAAQKLPSVQTEGVFIPGNVKIDGKATEWNDKFQAYNSATEISYTIANDNEHLYLLVRAKEQDIVNRIVGGGLTLAIQKQGKKDKKNFISITYPVTSAGAYVFFNFRGKKRSVPDTTARGLDSVMKRSNKLIEDKIKWIVIKDAEGLDTLSVYNEDDIKAAGQFNLKKEYTFEISIPLKKLGISASDKSKFSYHVIINGRAPMIEMKMLNADGTAATGVAAQSFMDAVARVNANLSAPTDFWSEYTLAKK